MELKGQEPALVTLVKSESLLLDLNATASWTGPRTYSANHDLGSLSARRIKGRGSTRVTGKIVGFSLEALKHGVSSGD